MVHRVALVALVVVLAGCSVPFSGADLTDEETDPTDATGDGPETGTLTPWSETEFVVALDDGGSDTDYAPIIESTLTYWETNADSYLDHPLNFRFDPDAENPDLTVRIVDEIEECGTEEHAAGCAPYVTDLRQQDDPVDVRIVRGFSRESTRLVMKHEFGHALGLNHDDEPQDVMQSQAALATQPQPNATDRPVPWTDPDLSVYIDEANVSDADRPAVRDQVQHALDYYADGAEGAVPDNVTFTRTDNRTAADVRVIFPATVPCGGPDQSPQSCAQLAGPDPDRDGAREYYERVDIYLAEMSTDAVGWHVGRWLATSMGLTESELPGPFVDASFEERRSEWWESQ